MDDETRPARVPDNDGHDEWAAPGLPVAPDDLDGARLRAYVLGLAHQVGGELVVDRDGFSVDGSALDRPGSGHDRAFRDAAYTVWAWGSGRNFAASARALRLNERTLRRWARDGNWRARYAVDRMDFAPAAFFEATAVVLASYGVDAAEYLGAVVTGQEAPDKTRVAAALGVLDRLGLAPVRALQAPTLDTFTGQGGRDAPHGSAPTDGRSLDPVDALRRG